MLFSVCFAFPMCIHTEVECFLTDYIQHYSARGTAVHSLDGALVVH